MSEITKEETVDKRCAYCGGTRWYAPGTPRPENYCDCKYRFMRNGASGLEVQTTSRQHTVASVRKDIEERLAEMIQDAPVVYKLSITRLDLDKIAENDAKRSAKSEESNG